jgi:hypothetical protein
LPIECVNLSETKHSKKLKGDVQAVQYCRFWSGFLNSLPGCLAEADKIIYF